MTSAFASSPDGTFVITFTFPWADLTAAYAHIIDHAVRNTELPGFRKGKAPRKLVESKLNRSVTFSQALQHLLPESYHQAVTVHNLKPILHPRLHVTQAEEGKDWIVTATSCQSPQITLPDYTTQLSKQNIANDDQKLNHILDYLSASAQVTLPQILIDEETNHRLSSLADNLTNLGLTTKSYLDSKKLSPDSLKAQFSAQAKTDLTLEFALASIQSQKNLPDRKSTLDFLTSLI